MIRLLQLIIAALVLLCAAPAQAQKIYRFDGPTLVEIPARDPARRYRMATGPEGVPAYFELTPAEEAARAAEEALPPPPFSGLGRVIATRTDQVIPNNVGTAVDYTTEVRDIGAYHGPANPDRFVVGPAQGGVFDIRVGVRFDEASAAAGCVANTGLRLVQLRAAGQPVATMRMAASPSGDTEVVVPASDQELNPGDIVRVFVAHNCGGTMEIDSRISMRRLPID